MADCVCQVAGSFPYLKDMGIITAALRTNVNVTVTNGGLVLAGPALGDLSISGYAPLNSEVITCPGNVSVNYNWVQLYDCDTDGKFTVYFVPGGHEKAAIEGTATEQISLEKISCYRSFNASAADGPATYYLDTAHYDGYEFSYSGNPISIPKDARYNNMEISALSEILPLGSKLYLSNFSWSYTPPNIPIVNYSFLFTYDDYTVSATC
ncbi:MAG: hypothetical protein DRH15_04205 [Deltaproteobacteria bacterium]|nr:MAG: hypothetical protein DRH15_04205 [Deltaproteobacteria bacterium]